MPGFVADAETGTRRIQIVAKHEATGFLQANLFLKLQWAHRRHGFELGVKSRDAHSEAAGDFFDFERLSQALAQIIDRFGNATRFALRRHQMSKPRAVSAD